MDHHQLLQKLVTTRNYSSYLEIARGGDDRARDLQCSYKVVIDSIAGGTLRLDSTTYFAQLQADVRFDLIFIDGYHHCLEVNRELEAAFKHLAVGGTIVLHDCNPPTEVIGSYPQHPNTIAWCGDVWRTVALWRTRSDVTLVTLPQDWGCAILQKGVNRNPYTLPVALVEWYQLPWTTFEQERSTLLNLCGEDEVVRV